MIPRIPIRRRVALSVPPAAALFLGLAAACGARPAGPASLAGEWRAVLESPGGELPFGLRIEADGSGRLSAAVINGAEEVPFTTARLEEGRLLLRFDQYDSEIVAAIHEDGAALAGTWTRQAGRQRPGMTFRARKGASDRFGPPPDPAGAPAVLDVSGVWDVVFTDEKEATPARAEFRQEGERLSGTFLTPTGDYRYLAGDYRRGLLRLSCFDGGHAFLFRARAQGDGELAGDFWSRSSYHATWTARRPAAQPPMPAMPDPFAMTTLKNPTGRLSFTFPDLDGRPVSLADASFAGKVVLVDLFGSWCPNCNDQAPVLADLHRRYRERGLEIVGLAYEMTGDASRDASFVRKFAERHGIQYTLLLAGTSDKAEASLTLPDLSGVLAFPTLIFIGGDGAVKAIHTGFEGPGTGRHFEDLKARYASLVEELL